MSTQIRYRNLLCLIGVYTIRQETNNFQKISLCWDPANSAYPHQTSQLAAPNQGLHHPPGNQEFSENNHPNLSLCWDPANSAYLDQTPQLAAVRLIGPSARKQKNSQQNNHQIYLHVGTQRIMSTQIRRRNFLRLIGIYTLAGNQQFSAKQLSNFISMLGGSE